MKIQFLTTGPRQLMAALLLCSAPFLFSCSSDPVPQPNPGTGTSGPGSGTATNPGSGTATNPGSGTATNPGSGTATNPGTVVPVVDYIKGKSNLTFLAAAIARADIAADYNKTGLTVFAPTDDAFKAAGYASTAAVTGAPAATLKRILQYHVISSRIDLSAIPTKVNTSYQTTLPDARVSVYKVSNTDVSLNGAKVTEGDIATTGSALHIINQVLMPPTVSASEVPKANPELTLFMAAVSRAGISVENFLSQNSADGVTIFAPSNAAFKAAGYADEAAVKAADQKKLADILMYHILKYRAYAQTFQNGSDVVTAQGGSLRFNVSNGKVTIQGKGNGTNVANIVQADQTVTNGVLHVIDRVLLP